MADVANAAVPAIDDCLFRYWRNGIGISRTIYLMRRVHGQVMSFEQVRSRFARLANANG